MEYTNSEELYNGSYLYYDEDNVTYILVTVDEYIQVLRDEYISETYGDYHQVSVGTDSIFVFLGYITNTLNILVLLKMPAFSSLDHFLVALAVTNLLQITIAFFYTIHDSTGLKLYPFYEWVVLAIATHFLGNYLTCLVVTFVAASCIWRCIVITWPLRSRHLCTTYRAKFTIISVCVVGFITNAPIIASYTYEVEVVNGISLYHVKDSDLAKGSNYMGEKVMRGFVLLNLAIPMISMLVATIWIGVSLYKSRMERNRVLHQKTTPRTDHRTTLILIILVTLIWVTNIPSYVCDNTFVFIFEDMDEEQLQTYLRTLQFMSLFALADHSAHFFIYYALGQNFRNTFNGLFCKRFVSRKKSSGNQTPVAMIKI